MQIKSNTLVKVLVPVFLLAGVAVGMKSCSIKSETEKTSATPEKPKALADLTPAELKALGVEGDTPEDTLRTLVGTLKTIRGKQETLDRQNLDLVKENERLRTRNQNVAGQVNEAVSNYQKIAEDSRQQLQQEQQSLTSKVQELSNQLAKRMASDKQDQNNSDIPLGLGLDEVASGNSNDGVMWVSPSDQRSSSTDAGTTSSDGKSAIGGFPTSFLGDNALSKSKSNYEQKVKGYSNSQKEEESIEPVYTLPENSTLIGSKGMTALLGRVPINGTVTDPYPFKVLIGRDNLTANGIDLPDVEGAIVSGTASGDWTLSCVRGQVNSITFVFSDGRVRTLPRPDNNGKSNGQDGGKKQDGGIGWISDEAGIPCISGTRKSNASTYLPTLFALSGAAAAGEALNENQRTSQTNAYGGVTSTLTGDAGQAAMGKAIAGGVGDVSEWVKQRYGQTFDAVYVPPGANLAVHITQQLAIDYEDKGRKVRYDFSVPGNAARIGLD